MGLAARTLRVLGTLSPKTHKRHTRGHAHTRHAGSHSARAAGHRNERTRRATTGFCPHLLHTYRGWVLSGWSAPPGVQQKVVRSWCELSCISCSGARNAPEKSGFFRVCYVCRVWGTGALWSLVGLGESIVRFVGVGSSAYPLRTSYRPSVRTPDHSYV